MGKFCQDSNLKIYKVLLSSLIVLLDKYSYDGLKEVVIGAPVCKCNPESGNELSDKPVNSLVVLRNYLDSTMSFNELVIEVRAMILEAFENQNYSVDKIMGHLQMVPTDDEFPLFDVGISLDNIHDRNNLRQVPLNMLFLFSHNNGQFEGEVEYNSSLYEESTINQIVGHYTHLLGIVLKSMGIDLMDIDILSKAERNVLLKEFNDTFLEYPKDRTINEIFSLQVKETPGNIAVSSSDTQLSYSGLEIASNRLANKLRKAGVGRDSIVGLMVERSVEMMVGIIGIIKAGGAYLPIGLTVPEARREFYAGR